MSVPWQRIRIAGAAIFFFSALGVVAFLSLGGRFDLSRFRPPAKNISTENIDEVQPFYTSIGTSRFENHLRGDAAALRPTFTLEFSVFSNKSEAENMIDKLAKLGVDGYYTPFQREGRVLFRVRKGVYPNEQLALKAADDLLRVKSIDAKIVRLQ